MCGECELMHFNTDFRHPDIGELFQRTDITAQVEAFLPHIPPMIEEQLAALAGPEPDVPVGTHCWMTDRECPFWDRCFPTDEHLHVWTLYNAQKHQKWALVQQGCHRILDLPANHRLTAIQTRQRQALDADDAGNRAGTRGRAPRFRRPVRFPRLRDHQSSGAGLGRGRVRGARSWCSSATTSSRPMARILTRPISPRVPGDPREELALRLLDATAGAERIVMYSSFERHRIKDLAGWLPHLSAELTALNAKLVDLLPVIRDNVYHPRFAGELQHQGSAEPAGAGADVRRPGHRGWHGRECRDRSAPIRGAPGQGPRPTPAGSAGLLRAGYLGDGEVAGEVEGGGGGTGNGERGTGNGER